MIYEFLRDKKFVSFFTIILFSTILIRIIIDKFSLLNIYSILLKSIVLLLIIFVFIYLVYRTDLIKLLKSFKK